MATSMLRRAASVIDSLDVVIATRDAQVAAGDSMRVTMERSWNVRLAEVEQSYERVIEANKPDRWEKLKDILVTAAAVYVGALATK